MKTTPQERDTISMQLGAQFVYGRQVQVEVDPKWLYDLLQDYLELELKIQGMNAAVRMLTTNVAVAVADERAACADVADCWIDTTNCINRRIAEAIRARGDE